MTVSPRKVRIAPETRRANGISKKDTGRAVMLWRRSAWAGRLCYKEGGASEREQRRETTMKRPGLVLMLWLAGLALLATVAGGYPKPSAYPISWELNFEHSKPTRVVVTPRGSKTAVAYWYMTYTVTNLSDREQTFLPNFEMLAEDGAVIRSDRNIPTEVLETIRIREKARSLESVAQIARTIRVGEDQAKDGMAIWPEPNPRMGLFSIFVGGLSGEATVLKDEAGQVVTKSGSDGKQEPVILHKTLELNYHIAGDERYPGHDEVDADGQGWVMR